MSRPGMQGLAMVPLQALRFHPRNIRTSLGDLDDLAESIRQDGVLVPLMAQRTHGGGLQLIDGHRRWAAADLAGLTRVPVVISERTLPDDQVILLMLATAKGLPVEVADRRRAVTALRDEFHYDDHAICERLGIPDGGLAAWASGLTSDDAPPPLEPLQPLPPRRRRVPSRPRPPTIRPTRVHDLLQAWKGRAPDELLAELGGLLGGWQPSPDAPARTQPPPVVVEAEPEHDPPLPDGHPLPWSELKPQERDQGGYWLYDRWVCVLHPDLDPAGG